MLKNFDIKIKQNSGNSFPNDFQVHFVIESEYFDLKFHISSPQKYPDIYVIDVKDGNPKKYELQNQEVKLK